MKSIKLDKMNLLTKIKEMYDFYKTGYISSKGCGGKHYDERLCTYNKDCHYQFIFDKQKYCLDKEIALAKKDESKN